MKGFKNFQHVATTTSHSARAVGFYRDLLGFRLLGRLNYPLGTGRTIDFFDIGNGGILEIFAYYFVPTKPTLRLPDDTQMGLRHIGFRVASVEETTAKLTAAGVNFLRGARDFAVDGIRSAAFEDPDGTVLEIFEGEVQYHEPGDTAARRGSYGGGPGLCFDHVAVTVADLDKTVAFYRNVMGFGILGRRRPGDPRGLTITSVLAGSAVLELFSFSVPTIPFIWSVEKRAVGLNHIGFEVENTDVAHEDCRAAGARVFADPIDALTGEVRCSWLLDPDGNALELINDEPTYNG